MTEQHPSFGGVAVADPRSAEPVDFNDSPEPDNRRKLAIAGAILGVVVLLVAAFFLLKGHGSSNGAAGPVPRIAPLSTSTSTHAAKAAKPKPITLPKSYSGVVGRDPFKALYTAPVSTSSSAGGASGSGSTPVVSPVPPTTTTPGGTTTPTTTNRPPVFRPVWIKLISVNGSVAHFQVGWSNHKTLKVHAYKVTAPKGSSPAVFANNFGLLKVHNGQVLLQYGDGTPFVLDMQHNVMIVN